MTKARDPVKGAVKGSNTDQRGMPAAGKRNRRHRPSSATFAALQVISQGIASSGKLQMREHLLLGATERATHGALKERAMRINGNWRM